MKSPAWYTFSPSFRAQRDKDASKLPLLCRANRMEKRFNDAHIPCTNKDWLKPEPHTLKRNLRG